MKISNLFGFLSSAIFGSSVAEDSSNVLVLTKDNFESTLAENSLILVEFYAPWCGHCKALAPEYEKAADELVSEGLQLAKVDCTVETDICSKHGIQGYPTLKLFRDSNPTDYNKDRKADAIVGFMKKQLLPAISEISEQGFDEFISKDKVVVVAFAESEDDEVVIQLTKVANLLRDDYVFAYTTDKSVITSQNFTDLPQLVLFKKFDEKRNIFPENLPDDLALEMQTSTTFLNPELITKFVQINSVPLMNDIGPENYSKYIEAALPLAFMFHSNAEEKSIFQKEVEPLAKKYKGKVNFVFCDANQFGGHASNLNLKEEWPALGIQMPESGLKYPFNQSKTINEADVDSFLEDFLSGKISPSIKSAPIPETNDEPVKIVVADNFESLVLDTNKHVFVEFYAPWCAHCKRLAPIWEELAVKLESNANVVIAKMDATENDVPPSQTFTIEGFPTLKLFKKDNVIVDYSGDRSLNGLLSFLKENLGEDLKDEVEEDKEESHDEL